jgi:murein L,D-transpeptidase YafK
MLRRLLLPMLALGLLSATSPVAATEPPPSILVLKAERRLELHRGDRVVKTYRIGLGNTPTGAKQRQGDGRTPEGTFYVCVKNPKSKYHLSLGLSYPTPADAARGLRDGLVTQAQHDAILAAHKKGATPPWNTFLGGEVFIHGSGSGSDWTLGCVALDDADMTELYSFVEKGTAVIIRP